MKKLLSMAAVTALLSTGAMAAGTEAGVSIKNTATLSFSVGGIAQTGVSSNEDTFVVDKKIDFLLSNDDGNQIEVIPGSTDQITTWSFTNEGNMDQDFTFTAQQLTGSESIYDDADTKDTGDLTLEYDDGGTWKTLSTLTVAVDASITIRIKTDIDIARVDGDVMNIQLKAVAVDSSGSAETATSGSDTKDVMDTVLAEGTGITTEGNTQHNNTFTRWGGYIVASPNLSLTKLSCVLKDPVNSTSNPKRIPGATLLYIFDIENSSTTKDATDVNITDTLSGDLDYTTIANLQSNDGQSSCSCTDGEEAAAGTSINNGGSDPELKLSGLTITQSKHNCVSFEIGIK